MNFTGYKSEIVAEARSACTSAGYDWSDGKNSEFVLIAEVAAARMVEIVILDLLEEIRETEDLTAADLFLNLSRLYENLEVPSIDPFRRSLPTTEKQ